MAIKLEVFGHNLEVTDRIREYVDKKIAKLERLLPEIDDVKVDLSYLKSARSAMDRQVAQVTIHGRRFVLRTEERGEDIFTAFDAGIDKMQRQIERFKGKRNRGRGDGRSAAEVSVPTPGEVGDEKESLIVRRKTFELVPMTEAEALEQMQLVSHDNFFIFYNINTQSINIIYLRRDGSYGLIEPKVGELNAAGKPLGR